MLRESEGFSPVSPRDEKADPARPRHTAEGKIPVNSAKYEGKMGTPRGENSRREARAAEKISGLIDESSAILVFLRKSFSELSTSY